MSTITWNGAGSNNNWDNTNNWDSTSLPTGSDDVLFNSTSTKDCTVNLSPSINSITIDTGYNGRWLLTGYDLTTAVGFTDNGAGNRNYGNSIRVTGDGPFHISSTVGTITANSCSVYLQGNNNLDCSKAITFLNLELAYSDKTTNNSSTGTLTLSDGTFHLHGGRYANGVQSIYCNCSTQSNPLAFDSGSSASGSTALYVRPLQPITVNVPALPTSWYLLYIQGNNTTGTATVNINADLTSSYLQMLQNSTGTLTINTNDKGVFASGGYLYSGCNNASGTFNLNCGSSKMTFSGSALLGLYSAGVSNYDLGTSNWTIAGALTLIANNTLTNTATSSMSFTTTLDSTITSLGKTLPALTVNKTSGAVRFADNLICKSLSVASSNNSSLITASGDITSNGNIIFDGAGSLTLNGGLRLLGDGTCRFANTLGTVTGTSATLEFDGTIGSYLTDNKGVTLKSLYISPDSIVTNSGSAALKFQSATTPVTLDTSSRLNLGGTGEIRSIITSASTFYSQASGSKFTGTGSNNFRCQVITNGVTGTLPSLNMDGTGVLMSLYDGNGRYGCTYQLSGDLNIGSNAFITSIFGTSGCDMTFNGNGYNITCGEFRPGSNATGNTATVLMGSGTYNCSSYTLTADVTRSVVNFQTSNWICSGNFTTGTNHIISMGSSGSIRMMGTSSILTFSTLAAGSFNLTNMDITASGSNISIKDNIGTTLRSLIVDNTATATINGSAGAVQFKNLTSSPLKFNNGGTLTLSQRLNLGCGVSGEVIDVTGNPTLAMGSSMSRWDVYADNLILNLPSSALTITGTGTSNNVILLSDQGFKNYRWQLNSNFTTQSMLSIFYTNSSGDATFNTNNYSLSTSTLDLGGSSSISATGYTYNFGDSTVSCLGFNQYATGYNSGRINYNFSTSKWTCGGSWTFRDNTLGTIDTGTSTITFNKTATLRSNEKTFYNLILNAGGSTVTAVDRINIANDGRITVNSPLDCRPSSSITLFNLPGSYTFDGTGSITIDGTTSSLSITVPTISSAGTNAWVIAPAVDSTVMFSSDMTVNSLIVTQGSFNNSGYDLISRGSVIFDQTNGGTILGSYLGFIGDGTCRFGGGGSVFSASSCRMRVDSSIGWEVNRTPTLKGLTLGNNAKVIKSGSGGVTLTDSTTVVFLDSGSLFTFSGAGILEMRPSASTMPYYFAPDATWNGNGVIRVSSSGPSGLTFTLPYLNYTGSGWWGNIDYGIFDTTFVLSDIFKVSSSFYPALAQNPSARVIFDTSNYDFTCTTLMLGANSDTATSTVNLRSSNISIAGLSNVNKGTAYINLQNANIYCAGGWVDGTVWTLDPGTSTVTFIGGGTLTSNGRSFYNFATRSGGATLTSTDQLSIANGGSLHVDSSLSFSPTSSISIWSLPASYTFDGTGSVIITSSTSSVTSTIPSVVYTGTGTLLVNNSQTGNVVTFSNPITWGGSINFNASPTLNLSSSITMSGSDSTLTLGNGLISVSGSSCNLYMNGTNMGLMDNTGVILKSLTLGSNAKLTSGGSATTTLQGNITPLTMGNDSSLTLNRSMYFYPTTAMTLFSFPSSYLLNGSASVSIAFRSTGDYTVTVPAINYTGSGMWYFAPYYGGTYDYSGNINLGSATLRILGSSSYSVNARFNSSNITCGALLTGCNSAGASAYSFNAGSGTHIIGSYDGTSFDASGYSSTVNFSTSDVTCLGNFTTGANQTTTFPPKLRMIGASSSLTIPTCVTGSITSNICDLRYDGTIGMTHTDNETATFKSLTLGVDASVNLTGSGETFFLTSACPLTLNNDATATINGKRHFGRSSSGDLYSLGNNAGFYNNGSMYMKMNNSNITLNLPAINVGGTSGYIIYTEQGSRTDSTYLFTGNHNYGTSRFQFYNGQATSRVEMNLNNYDLTCSTVITGGRLDFTGGSFAIYYGSGNITCTQYDGSSYNNAFVENFQSSKWICTLGSWRYNTNHIINPDTFQVTFTTNNATVLSSGKSFYDMIFNQGGKTWTISDPLSCNNLLITDGSWTNTGTKVTTTGNVTFNGSGSVNLGNGFIFNGSGSRFTLSNTLSTVTGCDVTCNDLTGFHLTDNKGVILKVLSLGEGALAITDGSSQTTYQSNASASALTMGNDSTLTINSPVVFFNSSSGASLTSIGSGCALNGTGQISLYGCSNGTTYLPYLNYTGSGNFIMIPNNSSSANNYITLSGDATFGPGQLYLYWTGSSPNQYTFNTNGYNLNCGNLKVGTTAVSGSMTFAAGSSTIRCTNLDNSLDNPNFNLILSTSKWHVTGNWSDGSNWTIDTTSGSIITLTSDGTHIVTSRGKNFPKVITQATTTWH